MADVLHRRLERADRVALPFGGRLVRGKAQHLGSQLLLDPPDRVTEASGERATAELSARRDALLAAILQATAGKR